MPKINLNLLSKKINNLYNLVNNTLVTKEKEFETEVGDLLQTDFFPQVKIKRWSNEANFSLRLIEDFSSASFLAETEKIKLIKADKEVHFYSVVDSKNEKGSFEFEVVLKEVPVSNVFNFSIQSKNLNFFFQDEITEAELNENKTLSEYAGFSDEEIKRAIRPENVLYSYAVYHSSKSNNKYKTGKAFHIFRPNIIDAEGKQVKELVQFADESFMESKK